MDIVGLIGLAVSSIFINNVLLAYFWGCVPFWHVPKISKQPLV